MEGLAPERPTCAVCEGAEMRWTVLSATPDTIAMLGLPKPKDPITLRVCHGCYIKGVSTMLAKLGLPRVVPATQLSLPFDVAVAK